MATFGLAACVIAVLGAIVLAGYEPSTASAHPLGNFTRNRYSRLELYADAILVKYVVDLAEIPTLQEMQSIGTGADGSPSAKGSKSYLNNKTRELVEGIVLEINGSHQSLDVLSQSITYPPGAAGLSTLRIELLLRTDVDPGNSQVFYEDTNFAGRLGWKEIVVVGGDGVEVVTSSAPSTDRSSELTSYPEDRLSSPPDVTHASFTFVAGAGEKASYTVDGGEISVVTEGSGSGFTSLVAGDRVTLSVVFLALLAALGFGAVHALEPGHGKTLVAAYFAGIQGTARQALALGAIIAITHTVGVMAIGLVVLFGSKVILPEDLYPWLSLFAGLLILGLGIRLAVQRIPAALRHRHTASSHTHSHDHGRHTRSASGGSPWRDLFVIGLIDGLVPSPSTLLVLVAAVSLDRIGLGIALIVAFSVGLATVLTAVSLSLVYARRIMEYVSRRLGFVRNLDRSGIVASLMPAGAAAVLVIIGLVFTIRALANPSVTVF
ncbi:MAG: sulfite exporter TauE/SafE family protein [Chloroflexi bacterium]|nr:sulfite exporter TauE/SafE family protein [Chloroflexota bacterium]